jgi:tetratricopeptide (TPR) repeat protein
VRRLHIDDAKASIELALATAHEQIRRNPKSVDVKTSLAEILTERASSLIQAGDLDAARAPLSEGRALWADINALRPGDKRAVSAGAESAGLSGLANDRLGNYAQSLIDYRQCAAAMHGLFVADPSDRTTAGAYIQCQSGVATESLYSGAADEAIKAFQDILVELKTALTRNPLLLDLLAQISGMATNTYATALRLDLAEPEADRAVETAHRLVGQDPANGLSKYWLGVALHSRCKVDLALGKWKDLVRDATAEIAIFTEVLAGNPTDTSTQRLLIRGHDYRAIGLEQQGSVDSAISEWDAMVAQAKKDGSTSIRVLELEAHVQIWRALGTGNPARVKSERAAAKALIDALDKVEKQALWNARFKLSTMKAAYLDGNVEAADRGYSELQTMDLLKSLKDLRVEIDASRHELCERLARQPGPRCRPEKELQVKPVA